MKKPNCRYCDHLIPNGNSGNPFVWDSLIFESANFVVVPTLGAIVEGWLIIVPKPHFLCFGEMPLEFFSELQNLTRHILFSSRKLYGPTVLFEHGPSAPSQNMGCTIDHAHLHVVPTNCDLLISSSDFCPQKFNWTPTGALTNSKILFESNQPYLYIQQNDGKQFFAVSENFPRQFLRRVIAKHHGNHDQFDWETFPFVENIERTLERYQSVFFAE